MSDKNPNNTKPFEEWYEEKYSKWIHKENGELVYEKPPDDPNFIEKAHTEWLMIFARSLMITGVYTTRGYLRIY